MADAQNGPAAGAVRDRFCPGSSGGEALEEPRAVERATEAEPVVEPAWPALPKLDPLWHEPEATPVRRPRNRLGVGMLGAKAGEEIFEGGSVGDHRALR